jgi:hypothetical protein
MYSSWSIAPARSHAGEVTREPASASTVARPFRPTNLTTWRSPGTSHEGRVSASAMIRDWRTAVSSSVSRALAMRRPSAGRSAASGSTATYWRSLT